jgi:hypothetical protein
MCAIFVCFVVNSSLAGFSSGFPSFIYRSVAIFKTSSGFVFQHLLLFGQERYKSKALELSEPDFDWLNSPVDVRALYECSCS